MQLPRMLKVRQHFERRGITDLPAHVSREVGRMLAARAIRPGSRIAIAVGSRGINHIPEIVAQVVAEVRKAGGEPFIIPAMGSHGGGTAEGQAEVLKNLGVTAERVGAPIISSLDVVQIGETEEGLPVYLDKNAAGADGIILVNRVKAHTDFHGPTESGLIKMLCIGLGKHKQATLVHYYGVYGLLELIPKMARVVLAKASIICGVAVVEDAYDEPARVIALAPPEIEAREKELLLESKALMPSLPFDALDVLVVDRLGKNISGTGMDTNIIGRLMIRGEKEPDSPRINKIVLLDLTEETHGNALGVGLADFTTRRLVEKIDHLDSQHRTDPFAGPAPRTLFSIHPGY